MLQPTIQRFRSRLHRQRCRAPADDCFQEGFQIYTDAKLRGAFLICVAVVQQQAPFLQREYLIFPLRGSCIELRGCWWRQHCVFTGIQQEGLHMACRRSDFRMQHIVYRLNG